MKKRIQILLLISLFFMGTGKVFATSTWQIQSIDVMKVSRDDSRQPNIKEKIPGFVADVARLGATHIAIGTPYDEEFYPVLKVWVDEARKNNLKVWFRGNFSGWENWFDYPLFKSISEHHLMQAEFIAKHPDLFADGDIFTPVPEPENGLIHDPRFPNGNKQIYLQFLLDSYDICKNNMAKIGKNVACGYFSMNGDIARDIMTKEVAQKLGVVVVDHYVKSIDRFVHDIRELHQKFDVPIVLGEFGAPIPDIHGQMDQSTQAKYILDELIALNKLGPIVKGVNYWTAFGGSTRLFDDVTRPRQAASSITAFFIPQKVTGTITDQFGKPISDISLSALNNSIVTKTDSRGIYEIFLPKIDSDLVITSNNLYFGTTLHINASPQNVQILNVSVFKKSLSFSETVRQFIRNILNIIYDNFK
jgi:hypothetical protein